MGMMTLTHRLYGFKQIVDGFNEVLKAEGHLKILRSWWNGTGSLQGFYKLIRLFRA
jgi:hypothetical protein